MADTEIMDFEADITFEPMVITASPNALGEDPDIARVREILRPLIMELLMEEYDVVQRMMGGG
jgi:hypothetical protein